MSQMTTTTRLWLGFGALVVLLMLSLLTLPVRISSIDVGVPEQADVARRFSATANEVELNLYRYVLGVSTFAEHGEPDARQEALAAITALEQQVAEFRGLAKTDAQQQMASDLAARWQQVKDHGQNLLAAKEHNQQPTPEALTTFSTLRADLRKFLNGKQQTLALNRNNTGTGKTVWYWQASIGFALTLLIMGVVIAVATSLAVTRSILRSERIIAEQGKRERLLDDHLQAAAQDHPLKREFYHELRTNPAILTFLEADALDGLWYWDLENPQNGWMSPGFWRTLGFPPGEKNNHSPQWQKLILPEDLRAACEDFRQHCTDSNHNTHDQLVRFRHQDGSAVMVRCHGLAIRDASGKPVRMLGVHHDVSAILQEEGHRVSEQQFRLFFEKAAVGAVQLDQNLRIIRVNQRYCEITGYSAKELLGRDPTTFDHPEERQADQEAVASFLRGESPLYEREKRYVRKNGEIIWVLVTAAAIRDEAGNLVSTASIVMDITARKHADEERGVFAAQLQQTQKLECLAILSGGIAHDFNNLLTGIMGYCDLAQMNLPSTSTARPLIEKAVNSARQAAELTKQMLAYSGKGRFVLEPLNLSNVVEDMGRLAHISIARKCVLKYNLQADLPMVQADAAQMHQLLMNLIVNASEAIGERSGIITISTSIKHCDRNFLAQTYINDHLDEGDYVVLEVADDGSGMSPEVQSKIFDPFFTTKFTGRGLGLSAVLGIVRGHQGAITCTSEVGKGTTFTVFFPTMSQQAKPPGQPTKTSNWEGSGTVLVVDDEESIRELATLMLTDLGFTVVQACDGQEAVDIFKKDPAKFALVLLDMTMPHLDGAETFREMRRIRADLKVILSSGYSEQTATSGFVGKGLAGFLHKPYRHEELEAIVRKVLNNAQKTTSGTGTTPPMLKAVSQKA